MICDFNNSLVNVVTWAQWMSGVMSPVQTSQRRLWASLWLWYGVMNPECGVMSPECGVISPVKWMWFVVVDDLDCLGEVATICFSPALNYLWFPFRSYLCRWMIYTLVVVVEYYLIVVECYLIVVECLFVSALCIRFPKWWILAFGIGWCG